LSRMARQLLVVGDLVVGSSKILLEGS